MSLLFKKSAFDSMRDAEMIINNRPLIINALSRARFDKAQEAFRKVERGVNNIGGKIKQEFAEYLRDYNQFFSKFGNRVISAVNLREEGVLDFISRMNAKYNTATFGDSLFEYYKECRMKKDSATEKINRHKRDDDDYLE